MIKVTAGTVMTPSLLRDLISKHKTEVRQRNRKLQDAYLNKYEIFSLPKKADWKPDNRIAANFARYIVTTFNGFFIGIPVKYTSADERVSALLEEIYAYNDIEDEDAEVAKITGIHGSCNEMYYLDDDGKIGIHYVSPMESFMVYDDSILQRPMFFIRYYMGADKIEHGSWSDLEVVQHFDNPGSIRWSDEPQVHGFDGVPASEFVENEERHGVFEDCLSAINAFNKALSEKANDVDAFADAYLKILGAKVDDKSLQMIRRNRIINFDGDLDGSLDVDFLQKPSSDTTQENLLKTLERLIFQLSMVANISDEDFGSASGIALRYKLSAMSNMAKVKERKFQRAMSRRHRLIFSNPAVQTAYGVSADDWIGINCLFTRNYPANIADEAETAAKLDGIVSRKTQLGLLSFVESPDAEMETMQQEKADETNQAYQLAAERLVK